MKAITYTQYGPPDVLHINEVEQPEPASQQILVKIRATTVSVADVRVRGFRVPKSFWLPARLSLGVVKPRRPVLGMELAGDVVAVGSDVTRFQPGDAVFAATLMGFGAYAEYTCLSEDGPVAIKPSNITYEEAAALPIGARTALHYVKKLDIQPGQNILVYGASGSVGTYAVQLARYYGAEVTGVCSTANLDLVRSLGANDVIDYTKEDFTQRGPVYDVVFEAVDKSAFVDCMHVLKRGGTYVNVTTPLPGVRMVWASWTEGKKLILGESSPETAADLNLLKDLVEQGVVRPVIDRFYNLEQIVDAHRYVDEGHKKGNVVVRV